MDPQADIAMLRAEVESLKALVQSLSEAGGGAGNGFGPDMGLPITPLGGETQGAFRWEGNKITHCNFYASHQIYELADVTVQEGQEDGTWYLNVPHATPANATVSKTAGQNNEENTATKLFEIENGKVKKDYRGMPFIPIYA